MTKNKLTRRSFLGLGAAATIAGAAGLAGCAPAAAPAQSQPTASGATASDGQPEAMGFGGGQGPTSMGYGRIQNPSFMTPPEPLSEGDAAEVQEADVIILGAGNAGCAAAASCADKGLSAIVLEKLATVQGRGGGIGLCNTKFTKSHGESIGVDLMVNIPEAQHRWIRSCGSRVNEALVSLWFNKSGEAGDWLIDKAAEYGVEPDSFRAYAPKAIIPESFSYHQFHKTDATPEWPAECSYFQATNVLYVDSQDASKHDKPATYLFETTATQLLKEGDKVTGVFATDKDGEVLLFKAAKGVVIATGGIHDDPEMVDYYCEENVHHVLECQNTPVGYSTGDGIKMGLWAGGAVQDGPFPLMLHPQAGLQFHGAFMFLNMEGERFMNEATWVQGKSMNVMHQTDDIAWSIFDADFAEQNVKTLEATGGGGMFWDTMGGNVGDPFVAQDYTDFVNKGLEADDGKVFKCDTLDELAEKTGIPADKLKASVERYNELVTAGSDEDFHKQPDCLFPVAKAPFYAAKVGVALLAIVGGLKINTDLQVLTAERKPIEGLYAIGNASGDIYSIDYPINMAGNSNGRALTWGYLIGDILSK
ncbi:FAD-dependent oxidoreductase [Arabiibacter massiliensis]|uniref:FAD-dependent oxidoreductase n=1 Tax=Arabiibacter massiliensis TaxID=1870985 RepID=UPI00155B3034|nr:FAD-binding protein [Arabiibacter massiliensis]